MSLFIILTGIAVIVCAVLAAGKIPARQTGGLVVIGAVLVFLGAVLVSVLTALVCIAALVIPLAVLRCRPRRTEAGKDS